MRYAKFIARREQSVNSRSGGELGLHAIGFSHVSASDAEAQADRRLTAMVEAAERDELAHYEYGQRPVVEELVRELHDDQGNLAGVLTRNRLGCLVLNAPRVPFFDIDLIVPKPNRTLLSLFMRKRPEEKDPPGRDEQRAQILERLQRFSDFSFRLYDTARGFRGVVTNRLLDPTDEQVQSLFEQLECDELYCQLCLAQQCFRARLTPKPYRCGMSAPPGRFPRTSDRDKREFEAWVNQYDRASERFSVCRLAADVNAGSMPAEIAFVLSVHDAFTLNQIPLELA